MLGLLLIIENVCFFLVLKLTPLLKKFQNPSWIIETEAKPSFAPLAIQYKTTTKSKRKTNLPKSFKTNLKNQKFTPR